jgi:HlyD family secretion protein
MAVVLDGWGGDHPLDGRVRLVEPAGFTRISALGVEEQRVKVIVALGEIPPSLGDGFRVEARIVLWRGDAVVVPASAVFRDHDRWAIYAVEAEVARLVRVELGHRGRTEVEIVSGPAVGATVVLHPGDRVGDGVRLALRR